MATVYDNVPGIPGMITRTLRNGNVKQSRANQLERVIALHEDVQRKLHTEGKKIAQRAQFRLNAAQERHIMVLKEQVAKAAKEGDYEKYMAAQRELDDYFANRTQVWHESLDVDYNIGLYRPDGKEFHVEVKNASGRGGLRILKKSLNN